MLGHIRLSIKVFFTSYKLIRRLQRYYFKRACIAYKEGNLHKKALIINNSIFTSSRNSFCHLLWLDVQYGLTSWSGLYQTSNILQWKDIFYILWFNITPYFKPTYHAWILPVVWHVVVTYPDPLKINVQNLHQNQSADLPYM